MAEAASCTRAVGILIHAHTCVASQTLFTLTVCMHACLLCVYVCLRRAAQGSGSTAAAAEGRGSSSSSRRPPAARQHEPADEQPASRHAAVPEQLGLAVMLLLCSCWVVAWVVACLRTVQLAVMSVGTLCAKDNSPNIILFCSTQASCSSSTSKHYAFTCLNCNCVRLSTVYHPTHMVTSIISQTIAANSQAHSTAVNNALATPRCPER